VPTFIRRPSPPVKGRKDYNAYRQEVREDFGGYCAYCGVHESEWPHGPRNYELDHFKPKGPKHFPHLINDFYNLRWCCRICNGRDAKGDHWPSNEQEILGDGFVDLCQENWQDHYQILPDAGFEPLTRKAIYTIAALHLNSEDHLDLRRKILASVSLT
jgi:uncharacterized protein (TIGR02646 family)